MTEGQMLFHWATKHQRTRYGNAPSTTHLSKTANCTLWQEWKLYPLDRQAWIWSWVEVSMYVMLRTTVHLCNIGCFQSNRVCQNSDLFRKRRHWNKPQTATFFKQQKRFWKNPEEQNTRTAPEEVLQFVQKNAQQSKLTTVNKLQAPQHLLCFFWKRIQQFHLFCNTCKTPMWPKNKAIIFVPKRTCLFFGNKGRGQQRVITNPKQKREVEKRDTQYARNKININHAHSIRRSGIYSDRHVRKNENNMNQKMHHGKIDMQSTQIWTV